MFETILVPLDGSDLAEQALEPAVNMAKGFGSRIVLIQAVDSLAQRLSTQPMLADAHATGPQTAEIMQQAIDAEKQAARKYLGALEQRLGEQGINVEALIAEGPAADVILGVAEQQGAGVIAMSTHGRGGLGRLIFGSVADAVLKRSEIPVLLVRSREKKG